MTKVRNLEEELASTRLENQNIKKELQDTEQNKLIGMYPYLLSGTICSEC